MKVTGRREAGLSTNVMSWRSTQEKEKLMKFKPEMLRVYLIAGTQDVNHDIDDYLRRVEKALIAGVTAFQFREKGSSQLTADERLTLAQQFRELTTKYDVPLIIDDDYELAIKVHADGVHVGQKDQRVEQVIAAVGDDMFVGYSCNTKAQIDHANQLQKIAYLGSGPVFPTGSKDDADPVMGFEKLKELVEYSNFPIVAVGGITPDNAKDTVDKTGVAGISGISMIMQSTDVEQTVKDLLSIY
jgi:thiamine-phosphate pyrophosphorylase